MVRRKRPLPPIVDECKPPPGSLSPRPCLFAPPHGRHHTTPNPNPNRDRTCLTSTSLWACIPCRISDTESRWPLREARYSFTCVCCFGAGVVVMAVCICLVGCPKGN